MPVMEGEGELGRPEPALPQAYMEKLEELTRERAQKKRKAELLMEFFKHSGKRLNKLDKLKAALKKREQADFRNRLAGAISDRDERWRATGVGPKNLRWFGRRPQPRFQGIPVPGSDDKPIHYPLPQAPQEKPYYSPLAVDPSSDLFHRKLGPGDGMRTWKEEMWWHMNRARGAQQSGHTLPPGYQDHLQHLYKLQGFGDI